MVGTAGFAARHVEDSPSSTESCMFLRLRLYKAPTGSSHPTTLQMSCRLLEGQTPGTKALHRASLKMGVAAGHA